MREGVVLVVVVGVALPESVREERECRVTPSSLSTFSADYNTHTHTGKWKSFDRENLKNNIKVEIKMYKCYTWKNSLCTNYRGSETTERQSSPQSIRKRMIMYLSGGEWLVRLLY